MYFNNNCSIVLLESVTVIQATKKKIVQWWTKFWRLVKVVADDNGKLIINTFNWLLFMRSIDFSGLLNVYWNPVYWWCIAVVSHLSIHPTTTVSCLHCVSTCRTSCFVLSNTSDVSCGQKWNSKRILNNN